MKNNLLPRFVFHHFLPELCLCFHTPSALSHDAVNRFYILKSFEKRITSPPVPMKCFSCWLKKQKQVLFLYFFINVLYFSCYTSQGVYVLCGQVKNI